MEYPLVSIIIPCYNGEFFVYRLLDSILAQSYANIEVIFVNDGSNDRTETVVLGYKERFNSKGINFHYLFQENKGQAAAINKALKIFSGSFVTWPDSDDYYLNSDSIRMMVDALSSLSSDYAMVRSDAVLIEENTLRKMGCFSQNNINAPKEELFEDCIMERGFWFTPGCYMVKSSILTKVIPAGGIYESRGGQNWQLFLPVLHKYKCKYINSPLFAYLVRNRSHSRSEKVYEQFVEKYKTHKDILENTISMMDLEKNVKEYYLKMIDKKYCDLFILLALNFKRKKEFIKACEIAQMHGYPISLKNKIKLILFRIFYSHIL